MTPSARQPAWQRLELTAFVHFGINTFTGREHGTGTENPDDFQPDQLDTDQWTTALEDAGFKLVTLTVKHHDGFLLFPSRYSRFGVASSSWRDGNGDVVRDFANSLRAQGLKVGFYISPSDLHEAQPGGRYANNSAAVARTIPSNPADVVGGRTFSFTADDYNTYFMNNLYELLTRYGSLDEMGGTAPTPPASTIRTTTPTGSGWSGPCNHRRTCSNTSIFAGSATRTASAGGASGRRSRCAPTRPRRTTGSFRPRTCARRTSAVMPFWRNATRTAPASGACCAGRRPNATRRSTRTARVCRRERSPRWARRSPHRRPRRRRTGVSGQRTVRFSPKVPCRQP